MPRALLPWVVVLPLSVLGMLGGHELAYLLTGAGGESLHGYLSHLPQMVLILSVLALVAASFVERGHRVTLWPFPALVLAGFVVQEHLERLAHDGTLPFLLDTPSFLVGLALQAVVACAAWLVARALIRIVGSRGSANELRWPRATAPRWPANARLVANAVAGQHGARAPPRGC